MGGAGWVGLYIVRVANNHFNNVSMALSINIVFAFVFSNFVFIKCEV